MAIGSDIASGAAKGGLMGALRGGGTGGIAKAGFQGGIDSMLPLPLAIAKLGIGIYQGNKAKQRAGANVSASEDSAGYAWSVPAATSRAIEAFNKRIQALDPRIGGLAMAQDGQVMLLGKDGKNSNITIDFVGRTPAGRLKITKGLSASDARIAQGKSYREKDRRGWKYYGPDQGQGEGSRDYKERMRKLGADRDRDSTRIDPYAAARLARELGLDKMLGRGRGDGLFVNESPRRAQWMSSKGNPEERALGSRYLQSINASTAAAGGRGSSNARMSVERQSPTTQTQDVGGPSSGVRSLFKGNTQKGLGNSAVRSLFGGNQDKGLQSSFLQNRQNMGQTGQNIQSSLFSGSGKQSKPRGDFKDYMANRPTPPQGTDQNILTGGLPQINQQQNPAAQPQTDRYQSLKDFSNYARDYTPPSQEPDRQNITARPTILR